MHPLQGNPEAELARRHHLDFMSYCWQKSGKFLIGHHTWKICERLDRAVVDFRNGISTFLFIAVPIRHGKSDIISRYFPPRFLGLFPESEIIISTYSQELSNKLSRFSRGIVESDNYISTFPNVTLSNESSSMTQWELDGGKGATYWTSIGGGGTGHGYHLGILDDYCVEENQRVFTKRGFIKIKDIKIGDIVLTHKNRWRKVTNKYYKGEKDTIKIKTKLNKILVTPEHLLYTSKGWKPAEGVTNVYEKNMQTMRKGFQWICFNKTVLLFKMLGIIAKKATLSMQTLWEYVLFKKRDIILFGKMQKRTSVNSKRTYMQRMWKNIQDKKPCTEILFCKMQKNHMGKETRKTRKKRKDAYSKGIKKKRNISENLRYVQKNIQTKKHISTILLNEMQKQGTFGKNDRCVQLQLSSRNMLPYWIYKIKTTCSTTRQFIMSIMRFIKSCMYSSYRPKQTFKTKNHLSAFAIS